MNSIIKSFIYVHRDKFRNAPGPLHCKERSIKLLSEKKRYSLGSNVCREEGFLASWMSYSPSMCKQHSPGPKTLQTHIRAVPRALPWLVKQQRVTKPTKSMCKRLHKTLWAFNSPLNIQWSFDNFFFF